MNNLRYGFLAIFAAALLMVSSISGGTTAGQTVTTPTVTRRFGPVFTPSGSTTPTARVTASVTPTPSPTPEDWIGPHRYPAGISPLTGLPVDDPDLLAFRPIAAKISNAPALVRPQAGLGQADVVFEHYAEGGLTRFTAVFLSQLPRRVGSIRSARLIDEEIPEMFESYLVYAGSSGGVREHIESTAFAERAFYGVETGPPAYYRDPALPVPHNLFADLVAVHDLAAQRGINSPPAPEYSTLAFSDASLTTGDPAAAVNVRYRGTAVRWVYESDSGLYWRWSDGRPHFDATLNRQVSAANVVVLYANHVEDVTIVESEWQGHQSFSIEIQLWGVGPAVFFRDGQRYDGGWQRLDSRDMFTLLDAEGAIMRLKPGVTFFQLVPLDFDSLAVE